MEIIEGDHGEGQRERGQGDKDKERTSNGEKKGVEQEQGEKMSAKEAGRRDKQEERSRVLRSLYFAPILFAIPGDRTPNLTTITVTTNYYTPYPMQRPWSRLSHSLMFTLCQILHHAYRIASHLGTLCISSPLYNPYLASCSSHVLLMTRTRPIEYDPLI